ncbi:MAG TPA: S41 family peptidase [Firmicutes bacterium]|nr:S41 family peptidase [Bacillota bacterium]
MLFKGKNADRRVVAAATFLSLLLAVGVCTPAARAISEADKYFERIAVFNEVLAEVQQKYVDEEKVDTEALVRNAVQGMLRSLDPHSAYMLPQDYSDFQEDTRGTFGGLGITIDVRDGWLTVVSPLPETPAFREGILAGDKIIKIEGESTEGMDIKEAVRRLRGEPGTQVTITIFRPSDRSTVDHTITRGTIHIPNVYAYVIDERIGYIRLIEFKQTASTDLDRALGVLEEQDIEGLILDLRFNSGGLLDMAVAVSEKFLPPRKRIVSIRGRNGENEKIYESRGKVRCDLPLVVLVNQASASASEIVAGAMQDWGRAVIIGPAGQRTFGKGSVQTVIPLRDDSALKLTTAKYYTPSGRSITDDQGIKPDIGVEIDEAYQRLTISLDRLAKLPKSLGEVKQILPPPTESQPAEEASEQIESTTPETKSRRLEPDVEVLMMEGVPDGKAKEESQPEVYDKELAKAVEILKAEKIWASAVSLFR